MARHLYPTRPATTAIPAVAGTALTIEAVLYDDAGAPLDLTGKTVRAEMTLLGRNARAVSRDATITDDEGGAVSLALGTGETAERGLYGVRFVVLDGDGETVVGRYPGGPNGLPLDLGGPAPDAMSTLLQAIQAGVRATEAEENAADSATDSASSATAAAVSAGAAAVSEAAVTDLLAAVLDGEATGASDVVVSSLTTLAASVGTAGAVRTVTGAGAGRFVYSASNPYGSEGLGGLAVTASGGGFWLRVGAGAGTRVEAAWFGTDPTGTADSAAAIQAALDFAYAWSNAKGTGPGTVYVGEGSYRMEAALVLPMTAAAYPHASLIGAGMNTTTLYWPNDLGAGVYAIDPEHQTPALGGVVSDLTLLGPGTRAVGVTPCDMSGLRLRGKSVAQRVRITLLRQGLTVQGGHNTIRNVVSNDNYYSVYAGAFAASHGNDYFEACDLAGATWATIGISGSGRMASPKFSGVVGGFSPWGIYKEATVSDACAIDNGEFSNMNLEACGHGTLYGAADQYITNCTFVQCAPSVDPGTTYRVAGQPLRAGAYMGTLNFIRQIGGSVFASPGTQAFVECELMYNCTLDDLYLRELLAAPGAVPFAATAAGAAPEIVEVAYLCPGGIQGEFVVADSATTARDLMGHGATPGKWRRYDPAVRQGVPTGVALHDAASGEVVLMQKRGRGAVKLAAGTTLLIGRYLKPDAAGTGQAVHGDPTDAHLFGHAVGDISGDYCYVDLRL